jgi:hypothetical protein
VTITSPAVGVSELGNVADKLALNVHGLAGFEVDVLVLGSTGPVMVREADAILELGVGQDRRVEHARFLRSAGRSASAVQVVKTAP